MTDNTSNNGYDTQDGIVVNKASPQEIQTITNVIKLLDKTVNQRKIFPKQHENVKKFLGLAFEELKKYLDHHAKLELIVKDFSISFKNEIIFSDDEINRSLPYLFFKDGMKILYFHKNLTEGEFQDFIEIVHENSLLPPIESDVVFSLWEKDFAHISFYATDEFLETKISSVTKPKSYSLDKNDLITGTIELLPEDKEALERKLLQPQDHEIPASGSFSSISEEKKPSSHTTPKNLNQEDFSLLELMIQKNRNIDDDDELIDLFIEMLLLDQRPEGFTKNLSALRQELDELIEKGDFTRACHIQAAVYEIRKSFSLHDNVNIEQVKHLISGMKNELAFKAIQEAIQKGLVKDMDSFFKYLLKIGPDTLPLVSQLFNQKPGETFLMKAPGYFHQIAQKNISRVFQVTENAPVELVRCVITSLGMLKNKTAVPCLINFIKSTDPSIQKDAIHALGEIEDITASKALIPLLSDRNSDIRMLAVKNMRLFPEETLLSPLISIIEDRTFKKKSPQEKHVFLKHICKLKSKRTVNVFKMLIKNPGLFSRTKKIETSLCAIEVLSSADWDQAQRLLEDGSAVRNKHIRSACRDALQNKKKVEPASHE